MPFIPRTTAPSRSDPLWRTTGSGGKNPCINIVGGSCLPNCFSGDTEVITDIGIVRIDSLCGRIVNVPTLSGWLPAKFDCFGSQELWEVKLGKHIYRCTADHRWPIFSQNGRFKEFVLTKDLKANMLIRYTFSEPVEYEDDVDAIRHGFVYGDGTSYSNSSNYTYGLICGKKKAFMPKWFEGCHIRNERNENETILVVTRQPAYGKHLPELTHTKQYLYNFLRGYFAADGSVDRDGSTIEITSSREDELNKVRDICNIVGIRTSSVVEYYSKGYGGWHYSYGLRLRKCTLSSKFFLNPDHRKRFLSKPVKPIAFTTVISVKPLHALEPVYCASQPDTTTITLGGGELTGQCVGYAFGRFMEILGTTPTLCRGNAGTWFGYNDGYQHMQTPQLGAVVCWSRPGHAGHVAIVEGINADGSLLISQSGYQTGSTVYDPTNSRHFNTATIYPPNYYAYGSSAYHFQGFIYNPACAGLTTALTEFIQTAKDQVGRSNDWTCQQMGIASNQSWSAAFVCAVAKQVDGLLNVIIPLATNSSDIARLGVQYNMGTWHKSSETPEPGDLICMKPDDGWKKWIAGGYSIIGYELMTDQYTSGAIGIVCEVTNNSIECVFGDHNSKVELVRLSTTSRDINGYYRPDWSKVGASATNVFLGPLYDTSNTPEDADLREIGYMTSRGEPSIISTGIKLAVVNYTSLLAGVWDLNSNRLSSSISQVGNLDNLDNVPRQIVSYLENKGLSTAAGIGVIANIKAECGFDISLVEYGYTINNGGVGMCQWTNYPRNASTGRRTNMLNFVGPDWRTDLTGQLDFLWKELTESYASVLEGLRSVPNNESGARQAADIFVRKFERPANIDYTASVRQGYASEFWNQIAIQSI